MSHWLLILFFLLPGYLSSPVIRLLVHLAVAAEVLFIGFLILSSVNWIPFLLGLGLILSVLVLIHLFRSLLR